MAAAVESVCGDQVRGGLVVVKDGHGLPLQRIECVEASHPVPDARSLAAGERMRSTVSGMADDETLLFLLSGGASALMDVLPDGFDLSDLQTVTRALLAAGCDIGDVNVVRKHLSRLKGGQLALACRRPVRLLVLNDVMSNDLTLVGSGPLVGDPSTRQQAATLLSKVGLSRYEPYLTETPKPGDPRLPETELNNVGDNGHLKQAARIAATKTGFQPLNGGFPIDGEAVEAAIELAGMAIYLRELVSDPQKLSDDLRAMRLSADLSKLLPACFVAGGETTVTLRGTGRGGRCTEMALGFAMAAAGREGLLFLAAASDGTDGPTDAAGGFADGTTVARAQALGLSVDEALANNDSYTLLEKLGDLYRTGPTLTNVNDLYLVLIARPGSFHI
jgi:hydroxypyruvate reductase